MARISTIEEARTAFTAEHERACALTDERIQQVLDEIAEYDTEEQKIADDDFRQTVLVRMIDEGG